MVNYHDHAVVLQDRCEYAFLANYIDSESQLTSLHSRSIEILACCGWTLLVCLPRHALDSHKISINSSWELFTTLDYEWSVIRRHRSFRCTIWVSINAPLLLGFVVQVRALE